MDHQRIKNKFGNIEVSDGIDLELDTIKKIIELHHGEIDIHSEWNSGTQVVIILPCTQPEAEQNIENIIQLNKFT